DLAGSDQRLAGFAVDVEVDEDALVGIVEVGRVVLKMLVIPFELARGGIDGERRIAVKRAVLEAVLLRQRSAHFRDPGIGLASAVVDGVGIGVISARNPRGCTEALLEWDAIPRLVVRITRLGNGVQAPQLFAVVWIVPGNEAAAWLSATAAAHAGDDL